ALSAASLLRRRRDRRDLHLKDHHRIRIADLDPVRLHEDCLGVESEYRPMELHSVCEPAMHWPSIRHTSCKEAVLCHHLVFHITYTFAWRSEEHTSELQSRENLVCC